VRNKSHEVVTLWYRPPDVLMGSTTYSATIDIWSTGCIFAEMATGKTLFPGKNNKDQLLQIFKLLGTPTEKEWPGIKEFPEYRDDWPVYPMQKVQQLIPGLDDDGYDLLSQMLTYDPTKRILAAKALQHPYFKSHEGTLAKDSSTGQMLAHSDSKSDNKGSAFSSSKDNHTTKS